MKLFMIDQIHLYRKLTEQQTKNTWEKAENLLCFIGIVFAIAALVATVIDVVGTPDNPPLDTRAYFYEPGDNNQLDQ